MKKVSLFMAIVMIILSLNTFVFAESEKVIVSNDDFMKNKSLDTISDNSLDGYKSAYSLNKEEIFDISKKSDIASGDLMYYEIIIRTKDVAGKVELDVIDSDNNGILSKEIYKYYIDQSDSGKNIYYITPSWVKIAMPYISNGKDAKLKINPTSENGVEIASVKLLNYKNKYKLEDMIHISAGMYDLSGAHEEIITYDGNTKINKTSSVIYNNGYVYSMGSNKVVISKVLENNELEVVSEVKNLGILRQLDITEDGNTLVITGRYYGVNVIDVTDKKNPVLYRYDSIEVATGAAVYKNYAFIANRIFGVEVVDISDVKNIKQVCVIRCGEAQSCDVVDGILYAGLWAQHRVDMFDIKDLNNPKLIGSVPLSGRGDGFAVEKDKDKTYIYAATGQHTYETGSEHKGLEYLQYAQGNGMDIYDITNPQKPIWLSTVRSDRRFFAAIYDYWTTKLVKDNGKTYAYFSTGVDGLYIYDVTDKKAPKRVGHISIRMTDKSKPIADTSGVIPWNQSEYTQSNIGNFDIKDGALFIAGEMSDLHIVKDNKFPLKDRFKNSETIDITSVGKLYELPKDVGNRDVIHYISEGDQIQAVDVKDGLVYAACGTGGIKIFDKDLNPLKTYPTGDITSDIQIVGDTLYIADGKAGMRIYKVDGLELKEIGKPYKATSVKQIEISPNGKWAMVQMGSVTQVVNVSNPASPKKHDGATAAIKKASGYYRPIMDGFAQNRYGVVNYSIGVRYVVDFGENCEADNPTLLTSYNCGTAGIRGGYVALPNGNIFTAHASGKYYFENSPLAKRLDWANERVFINDIKTDMFSGKPYVSKTGNTIASADGRGGYVVILGKDADGKYTNIISEFAVNGNPNTSYVTDEYVIMPLGHQGIIKMYYANTGEKITKREYKVKNNDGTYKINSDITFDTQSDDNKDTSIIVAKYNEDKKLVNVKVVSNERIVSENNLESDKSFCKAFLYKNGKITSFID